MTRPTNLNGYHVPTAVRTLRRNDPVLDRVIERIGPFRMRQRPMQTPFQTLLRAIVYQQLSGKAAGAIHRRVLALVDGRATAAKFIEVDADTLRAAGLSRAKVVAIHDLSIRTLDGRVPGNARLKSMNDESIIEALSAVRGVGRWSVEMMLIFNLRRPDVFPVTDLGIRKGFAACSARTSLPSPKELLAAGEPWRPYRSVASWYLWRASEQLG